MGVPSLSTFPTMGRLSTINASDYRLSDDYPTIDYWRVSAFLPVVLAGAGRRAGSGGVSQLYFCGALPVARRFPLGAAGCVADELPQMAFPDVYRHCDGVFGVYPYQYHSISFRALCAVSSGNRRYVQIGDCAGTVHDAVAAVYRPQEQRKRVRCTSAARTQKKPSRGADRAE